MNPTAWVKAHREEVGLGVAGMVLTLALYMKSKKAKAGTSGSASTANSTIDPATGQAYGSPADQAYLAQQTSALNGTANTTGSDIYNGLENQILGLQQATLALQQPPASTKTDTPAAPSGPFSGFGDQTIGGQQYAELGLVTGGAFTGYNVSGGAPVSYLVNGQLETNLSPQQISGLPVGTDVFTTVDAQNQGLIRSDKVTGEQIGSPQNSAGLLHLLPGGVPAATH